VISIPYLAALLAAARGGTVQRLFGGSGARWWSALVILVESLLPLARWVCLAVPVLAAAS
jgi:hypothetical protein